METALPGRYEAAVEVSGLKAGLSRGGSPKGITPGRVVRTSASGCACQTSLQLRTSGLLARRERPAVCLLTGTSTAGFHFACTHMVHACYVV